MQTRPLTRDAELGPRKDATSNATRLLCAGAYLDPAFRKTVIRELLTERIRIVAPAYGYDVVSVLAHALAARDLEYGQIAITAGGGIVIACFMLSGVLSFVYAALFFVWLAWAAAYLRRIATLDALMRYLGPTTGRRRGFDGRYPGNRNLTPDVVSRLRREQEVTDDTIFYGGYKPFIGAGTSVRRWSTAELLVEAPSNPLDEKVAGNGAGAGTKPEGIIPFSVKDITAYVAERIVAELRDEAPEEERIEALTVERRKYAKIVGLRDDAADGATEIHWRESYDSEREYLCARVGSWDQELVTSVFVGFDIKGNTLHTEFYTYVLLPIRRSYHLVDRLPRSFDARLMLRVALHAGLDLPGSILSLPASVLGLIANVRDLFPRESREVRVKVVEPADRSEFRLGRYAMTVIDHGALNSVREMAMAGDFHHFFQETDTIKYVKIVERRLLQIIATFLREHNVDLADHNAHQTNVLQQTFGDGTNFGSGSTNVNRGSQRLGGGEKQP